MSSPVYKTNPTLKPLEYSKVKRKIKTIQFFSKMNSRTYVYDPIYVYVGHPNFCDIKKNNQRNSKKGFTYS